MRISFIKIFLFITFWFFLQTSLYCQSNNRISTEEYIKKYKDIAVTKMKEYKIPASITLAQGILESGSGNSILAVKANNHFGIKCHKDWTGKKFFMDDDEKHECFRKYKDAKDSYRDHSLFLTTRDRYSFLFGYDITDYKKWAYGLKKAGYATNPNYPVLLIHLIEKYKLYKYDDITYRKNEDENINNIAPSVTEYNFVNKYKFKEIGVNKSGRMIYVNNKTKLIFAENGDTYKKIALEFNLFPFQVRKYNDADLQHIIKKGEIVYIKKKRKKAERRYKTHKVKSGESLWSISQIYGIREKKLRELNNIPENDNVKSGTVLKLR